MDNLNRRKDADVEKILEELEDRGKKPPAQPVSNDLVDAILAGLGQPGAEEAAAPPPRQKPPAPQATVKTPPQATGKAPAQAAEKPPAQAKAKPAPQAPSPEKPAPQAAAKPQAAPPAAEAPQPNLNATAAIDLSATLSGTRRLPIWDEEAQAMLIEHRTGKAAAIERVDGARFQEDEELASWYQDSTELATSRREQKRLERARKKRDKEAAKEAKRAAKQAQRGEAPPPPEAPDDDTLVNLSGAIAAIKEERQASVPQPEAEAPVAERPEAEAPEAEAPTAEGFMAEAKQPAAAGGSTPPPAPPAADAPAAKAPPAEAGPKAAPAAEDPFAGFGQAPAGAAEADTRSFALTPPGAAGKQEAPPPAGDKTVVFRPAESPAPEVPLGDTQEYGRVPPPPPTGAHGTREFELEGEAPHGRVPTAAFTKEFDREKLVPPGEVSEDRSLFVDDMANSEQFKSFFGETVIVEREDIEEARKARYRNRKSRTALLTGEFTKLTEQAETEDESSFEDYNQPQDAALVEGDLVTLGKTLARRAICSGAAGILLLWMAFGYVGVLPLPAFLAPATQGLMFCIVYLALLLVAIGFNFNTVTTGLAGLVASPTVDTPVALAAVAALAQGVLLTVQLATKAPGSTSVTLFGGMAALLLCGNAVGKRVRATAILENFRMASAGVEHSAAYVLDGGHEAAYHITSGLEEEDPSILISRPTTLVKDFLRQSFSLRWSDGIGRILGWGLLAVGAVAGIASYVTTTDWMLALSCLAATLCIGAPLSSTLVSGIPSRLLQASTSKLGAVVPGWSAIEELGRVNVVMAGARDVFPPSAVTLKGIKTFERERVDLAILYAASVLVEGCDTLRDLFLAVVQGKSEILYKVENLLPEPGRGFTAWVENSRIVIGNREMLQKHAIEPPPLEVEMKFTADGSMPVYLAVSGKLFAMFLITYAPDPEVQDTLDGLIKSGVSLLVTSEDMNVSGELIERVYQLPKGVVKVLGRQELSLLEPLRSYLPESEGVMTHIGTFTSFIGGMRAAAGCAASERMSTIIQVASVALAGLLCLLLSFSGGLADLSISIAVLYQLGWTLLVSALPFSRRY